MAMNGIQAEDNRPLRLLIFGASTTAYRGDLKIASFQVSEKLQARGIEHVFFNSDVDGNTTAMARKRFARDALGLHPDIVFILIGANDSIIAVPEGRLTFRFSTPRSPGRVQYRIKPRSGEPKDFGEWIDVESEFNKGIVKGSTEKKSANKYSFQFRTLDKQGKVSGLGGVDHVQIK